ncbi:MAG: DUF3619 family protein [Burkholderiales bacterium]|nr:DUF3619 family protein [Burkholderiales bacterium]MDQ3195955.1 DUF3619 family protein [Pseudomonadota bacterium]
MNEPVNEHQLGKKISGYLDRDSRNLGQQTLRHLQASRQLALSRYAGNPAQRLSTSGWATNSGYLSRFGGFRGYQFWVPVLVLVLALSALLTWQVQQHSAEQSDIDAALLAGDLPVDAYINNDFNQWVRHSLQ